jgi:hypothetical protein
VIRLQNINTDQTVYIIPSSFDADVINDCFIRLTNQSTYVSTDISDFTWRSARNGNTIKITFDHSLSLLEDDIFSFSLRTNSKIYYRDVAYVTSQTDKKQKMSPPDDYTEYEGGEDTYIIV